MLWSMRAVRAFAVFASAACASDNTSIRIERQPTTLAAASDDAWLAGGTVLVGAPGSFSFPQPVALRITLVDPNAEMPVAALVSMSKLTVFGDGVGVITKNVTCQPTYCEAELSITDAGDSMLQVTATGKDGEKGDCFYYGVHEDADPAAASPALYKAIEAKQRDCQQDLID